jgi:aspartokinase-like uncharacterized kinase
MQVEKAEIIAILRARGLDTRADWVDKQLPELVDTYENNALLRILQIDETMLPPADPAGLPG